MEATLKVHETKEEIKEIKAPLPYYYKEDRPVGTLVRVTERNGKLIENQICVTETGFRLYSESEFQFVRPGSVPISQEEFENGLDQIVNSIEVVAVEILG